MSGGGQFRSLRERVDRLEVVMTDGGLANALQMVSILAELVAELAGRMAAVDGGQNIDAMYSAAVARRAAAAVQAAPEGEPLQ